MDTTTTTRPAFRAPWTSGARAYFEADTFEAAKTGFKRKRKSLIFHMSNDNEAGEQACELCGNLLKEVPNMSRSGYVSTGSVQTPDKWSTWVYDPKTKSVIGGLHYGCSWSSLLGKIAQIHRSF